MTERDWPESPYDKKTIAEIVRDYAVVRGDLVEQYARDQLVTIIERRIETARTEATDRELARVTAALEALADEWECEPPGQAPTQYLHREVCPACSRADALRAALSSAGTTAPIVPPPCDDHREVQHRDGKPPWCNRCGWRHGVPAQPPVQIRAAAVSPEGGGDR